MGRLSNLSFRARIALAASGAVALAVVLASIIVFFLVRGELRAQLDDSLEARATVLLREGISLVPGPGGRQYIVPQPGFGEPNTIVQLVRGDGSSVRSAIDVNDVQLPVVEDDVELARSLGADSRYYDTHINDVHVRVFTVSGFDPPGYALQVARPLTEVDDALGRLRLVLLLVALTGIAARARSGSSSRGRR